MSGVMDGVERALRQHGWRPEHETWWHEFLRVWGIIGVTETMRHNLLVLAVNVDIEQRRAASFEISSCIGATMWSLLALTGES